MHRAGRHNEVDRLGRQRVDKGAERLVGKWIDRAAKQKGDTEGLHTGVYIVW